ncbi:MAG: hypothetical protein II185_02820, partial [Firmicutes bacterium]|nr:hypothetical protein [Bacillota bacterium]
KEAVYEDLKRFILGEEALGADEDEDEPAEAATADIAEKKHFDADPEDIRPAAEKAMDDAAQLDHSSPDISGVEKADVPHKGLRGFGSEFSEEPAEDAGSNDGELKLKAALKDLMEEPALEVDAPAQDNRPANEKAMDAASDYPDSPDLSGVDKQDVPHRGIRNVYETVDGLAEGAAEAAETVKEEVRKISEQAEDLAAKYNG